MICIAKTGSGKTCGFLLPSLHQHLQSGPPSRGFRKPVLLVLAPTRELAVQIMEETKKFGTPLGCSSVCLYGGAPKYPQIAQLQRGVDCVVATPGRINIHSDSSTGWWEWYNQGRYCRSNLCDCCAGITQVCRISQ